jgi:hypothetical protein
MWWLAAAGVAAAIVAQAAAAGPAWRLSPDGFGPFRVGMSFAQARKLAPRLEASPPELLASEGCDEIALPGHPGVTLMFIDGVLGRVDLFRPGLQTTRGVGPGDRVARVRRAYPGLSTMAHKYDEGERYLSERSGDKGIRFETSKGRIRTVYAGRWEQVIYVEGCL